MISITSWAPTRSRSTNPIIRNKVSSNQSGSRARCCEIDNLSDGIRKIVVEEASQCTRPKRHLATFHRHLLTEFSGGIVETKDLPLDQAKHTSEMRKIRVLHRNELGVDSPALKVPFLCNRASLYRSRLVIRCFLRRSSYSPESMTAFFTTEGLNVQQAQLLIRVWEL